MRVLVTGGSGFLGREVVKALVGKGFEVRSLSRRAAWRKDTPEVEPFAGSVLEPESCKEAVEGCGAVIHLAGRVSRDRKDTPELMRLHVDGTRHVLSAARDAGVDRVVYLSTSGTIAVSEDPTEVKNEAAPYPIDLVKNWPYYLSKIFAEQEALRFFRQDGLPVICLNPSLLLGPGDKEGSSTGDVKRFLDGMLPAIPKGGVSFVDVRDVADTVVTSLNRGRPGERYLLGAENLTTQDLFKRLARMSGRPAPFVRMPDAFTRWGAKLLGQLEQVTDMSFPINQVDLEIGRHGWYVDNKKAKLELGFTPRSPEATLRDTLIDLRERPEREGDDT